MTMDPLFDIEAMQADAAREKLLAGLPDWWHTLPDGPAHATQPTGKCMYDAPVQGLAARAELCELWAELYGHFGCAVRSHAWRPGSMSVWRGEVSGYQLDRHEATTLDVDVRRMFRRPDSWDPVPPCGHDADAEADYEAETWRGLQHRGTCRKEGCDWEGPPRERENPAVEDAMDHAHPGWRNLPPVPRVPDSVHNWAQLLAKPATQRVTGELKTALGWIEKVNAAYPDGWLEAGGPIRTVREKHGTRHVEGRTPYGGYDLALTCHLCGAAENLTWLTSNDNSVTVAGCKDGCPQEDKR